jgi:hypothetical protein
MGLVTPVLNGGHLLRDTIRSILDQSALQDTDSAIELVYVIQDGGSSDDSVEIARAAAATTHRVDIHIVSVPDTGLYDGLARGFRAMEELGGADWYAYLNAGDLWAPHCLTRVSQVAETGQIEWLMGLHAYYSPDGSLVHTRLPFRYRQDLLQRGVYGRGLPTVQQESTFWSHRLHETVPLDQLATFTLAGDAFLWSTFGRHCEPFIIEALLGGFRYHGHHLGVDSDAYAAELSRIAGPVSLATRSRIPAEQLLWQQPALVKSRFNPHLLKFRTETGGWANADRTVNIPSL